MLAIRARSSLTTDLGQHYLSSRNADNYESRKVRICLPMDVHSLLDNIHPIPGRNGYNGTIRSSETSRKIFSLECYKANMILLFRVVG